MRIRALAPLAVLAALLAIPAVSLGGGGKDKENAARLCKAERSKIHTDDFRKLYGTNKNRKNAFGKCVSKLAKQQAKNQANAAKTCKAERDEIGDEPFKEKYGTNENKSNAFGKCVSQHAKQKTEEQEEAKLNAAKTCKAERAEGIDAFKDKYGTNHNKRNAFGKCVSQHAKAKHSA